MSIECYMTGSSEVFDGVFFKRANGKIPSTGVDVKLNKYIKTEMTENGQVGKVIKTQLSTTFLNGIAVDVRDHIVINGVTYSVKESTLYDHNPFYVPFYQLHIKVAKQ